MHAEKERKEAALLKSEVLILRTLCRCQEEQDKTVMVNFKLFPSDRDSESNC